MNTAKIRSCKHKLRYLVVLVLLPFLPLPASGQWDKKEMPAWTDTLENPFAGEPEVIKKGKKLFNSVCFVCHGKKGKGDGVNAPALSKKPADLTSKKVQQQSDVRLFWKISEGNPPMLAFKNSLSKKERWQLVSYLRRLADRYPPKDPGSAKTEKSPSLKKEEKTATKGTSVENNEPKTTKNAPLITEKKHRSAANKPTRNDQEKNGSQGNSREKKEKEAYQAGNISSEASKATKVSPAIEPSKRDTQQITSPEDYGGIRILFYFGAGVLLFTLVVAGYALKTLTGHGKS